MQSNRINWKKRRKIFRDFWGPGVASWGPCNPDQGLRQGGKWNESKKFPMVLTNFNVFFRCEQKRIHLQKNLSLSLSARDHDEANQNVDSVKTSEAFVSRQEMNIHFWAKIFTIVD